MATLRHLPRFFLPRDEVEFVGVGNFTAGNTFKIPEEEYRKLTKVLRLGTGDEFLVMPNDGRCLKCRIKGRNAEILEETNLDTEPSQQIILAQSLPKGDKLDLIIRFGTQLGVIGFVLFGSDRSVMRWDENKRKSRISRLESIAREECEVSFRANLPVIEWCNSLEEVLDSYPNSIVLSEVESVTRWLPCASKEPLSIVVGPEGGWSPREIELIGSLGVTLGPRVLRVEFAGAAALSTLLLPHGDAGSTPTLTRMN